ncbi:MAG: glycerophosphodiester phosphodiesterase [Burkholderiaceae bacterium]
MAPMIVSFENWPYPRWIAHRGAGKLAPENTLAAFRLGAAYGYRMFECDVKLSADGVPFLLHDNGLNRSTDARSRWGEADCRLAADHPWDKLSQLDAGSWHSQAFVGEPLPSLSDIAEFCLAHEHFLNLEIKPSPGLEHHTGEVVAHHSARLWQGAAVPPLLTSFQLESLQGARNAAKELPRGLLLDSLWAGWLEAALGLGCVAVVCPVWDSVSVRQAHRAGLRCLSYTINDQEQAQRLLELGVDAIITDRIDLFEPQA